MTVRTPPSAPAPTLKDHVRRFVALQRERADLKARLRLIEDELAPLAEAIGEAFETTGTQRERVDGMTVYLSYTLWARPKQGDMQSLVRTLRDTEWHHLIQETVNIHSLSAAVRERLREATEQGIPEALALPPGVFDAIHISVDRQVKAITGGQPRGKGVHDGEH